MNEYITITYKFNHTKYKSQPLDQGMIDIPSGLNSMVIPCYNTLQDRCKLPGSQLSGCLRDSLNLSGFTGGIAL